MVQLIEKEEKMRHYVHVQTHTLKHVGNTNMFMLR